MVIHFTCEVLRLSLTGVCNPTVIKASKPFKDYQRKMSKEGKKCLIFFTFCNRFQLVETKILPTPFRVLHTHKVIAQVA